MRHPKVDSRRPPQGEGQRSPLAGVNDDAGPRHSADRVVDALVIAVVLVDHLAHRGPQPRCCELWDKPAPVDLVAQLHHPIDIQCCPAAEGHCPNLVPERALSEFAATTAAFVVYHSALPQMSDLARGLHTGQLAHHPLQQSRTTAAEPPEIQHASTRSARIAALGNETVEDVAGSQHSRNGSGCRVGGRRRLSAAH